MLRGVRLCRFVGARNSSQGDVQSVPSINRDNGQREVREFLLAEDLTHLLVYVVAHVSVANLCNGFGPGESGALAFRVVR